MMAAGSYWKSRPTMPGEMGEKEKASLRSLAAKPMIEQSIKFTTISKAMDERLDSNQFHSPQFQRKKKYKQVSDLPNGGALDVVELTEEELAAIREVQAKIYRQRELSIVRDHLALVLGVTVHLYGMHLCGEAGVSVMGVDMAHAVKLLGTTARDLGLEDTTVVAGTAVPASWPLAYAVGGAAGCAHLLLLSKGVKAVGAETITDAVQGAAGSARQVLFLPLAAASKHFGQAVLPFPLLVCGYLTYQAACLFHSIWEEEEEEESTNPEAATAMELGGKASTATVAVVMPKESMAAASHDDTAAPSLV